MDKLIQDLNVLVGSAVQNVTNALSRLPGGAILNRYVSSSYQNDPIRSFLELLLFLFALRYFLASKYSTTKTNYVKLTDAEIDELVDEWEPEPLVTPCVPGTNDHEENKYIPVVTSAIGPYVRLASNEYHPHDESDQFINLTSQDIYGFNNNEKFRTNAVNVVRKYGVGSCGPAGFYGNQDAHLKAEESIARFLGTESSILYSQGFATMSSVIPCFLKRGDIIVADRECNLSIQKGVLLSRATVVWYEHNDMADLEQKLILANASYTGGTLPRRFIITESVFENTGTVADIKTVVDLKKKYKYRIILDETWSIGTYGSHGNGILEKIGVNRAKDIELSAGSLSAAFGAAGGYCAANKATVEHQRITSLAYTFSATMPPYLASTISLIASYFDSDEFLSDYQSISFKAKTMYDILETSKNIQLTSERGSPVILFHVTKKGVDTKYDLQKLIDDKILPLGVLISRFQRLEEHELFAFDDKMIRLFVHSGISDSDIVKASKIIARAFV